MHKSDLHFYAYEVCILITHQTTNAKEVGNRDMVDNNHNDDDDRRTNWIRLTCKKENEKIVKENL